MKNNWWKVLTQNPWTSPRKPRNGPSRSKTASAPAVPPVEPPPRLVEIKPTERQQTIQAVIRKTPELDELYRSLGYDLHRRDRAFALLHNLEAAIRATVPDFPAFRAAVRGSLERMRADQLPDDPFLIEVARQAADDQEEDNVLLDLLNRNPVHERLLFLELMPIRREGEVSWRSPLEVSLPTKRPADLAAFETTLGELRAMMLPRKSPPPAGALRDAFEVLERALASPQGYVPSALLRLRTAIQRDLDHATTAAQQSNRQDLDTWVADHYVLSQFCASARSSVAAIAPETLEEFKVRAIRLSECVIEKAWLQRPWAIRASLTLLIEVALFSLRGAGEPAAALKSSAAMIGAVRGEIASGEYDAVESARRLQEVQSGGVLVPSLAFALLRIRNK